MRYYVTVGAIGAGPAITVHAGAGLAQTIARNLRTFRIWTGLDYEAFSISGLSIDANSPLTTKQLTDAIRAAEKPIPIDRVRVLIANTQVNGSPNSDGLGLLIGIRDGSKFAWKAAAGPMQAEITIPPMREDQKNAAIIDIFQDIMIANCSSIQYILKKFFTAGNSIDDFYRLKVSFIKSLKQRFASVDLTNADEYISLSSVARTNLRGALTIDEAISLGELWTSFLEEKMSDYFLNTEDAIRLVRNGYFHDTLSFTRKRHQYISIKDLEEIFGSRQSIARTGSYVLCVRTREPKPGDVGNTSAHFGLTGSGIGRLKLCDNQEYNASMRTLVTHGVVTPFRLFLKRP